MKKLSLFLSLLIISFVFPAQAQNDVKIKWNPVCRHNALYWAVTVREQYPTRIKYGYFVDKHGQISYHVQPQLKMGKNWYYFKVEDNTVFIIFDMNSWTDTDDTWVPQYDYYDLCGYVNQLEMWRNEKK